MTIPKYSTYSIKRSYFRHCWTADLWNLEFSFLYVKNYIGRLIASYINYYTALCIYITWKINTTTLHVYPDLHNAQYQSECAIVHDLLKYTIIFIALWTCTHTPILKRMQEGKLNSTKLTKTRVPSVLTVIPLHVTIR